MTQCIGSTRQCGPCLQAALPGLSPLPALPQLLPGSSGAMSVPNGLGWRLGRSQEGCLVKSCLERPLESGRAGSPPKAIPTGVHRWLPESRVLSWGAGAGEGRMTGSHQGPALTASHTRFLTSLPSQRLGSEGNPSRGTGSWKGQKDGQEKELGRDPHFTNLQGGAEEEPWPCRGTAARSPSSSWSEAQTTDLDQNKTRLHYSNTSSDLARGSLARSCPQLAEMSTGKAQGPACGRVRVAYTELQNGGGG